ncbi:hypothetical protein [Streptomyces sp. NBC_00096]|uniref:hypothetical protein n=1 Tax=Streptomyces sp. NBC_00096 TaxID=2975650 RepID=UPI0032520797
MPAHFYELLTLSVRNNCIQREIYDYGSPYHLFATADRPYWSQHYEATDVSRLMQAWQECTDSTFALQRDGLTQWLNDNADITIKEVFERFITLEQISLYAAKAAPPAAGGAQSGAADTRTPETVGGEKSGPREDSSQPSLDTDKYDKCVGVLRKFNNKPIAPSHFEKVLEALDSFGDDVFSVRFTERDAEFEIQDSPNLDDVTFTRR